MIVGEMDAGKFYSLHQKTFCPVVGAEGEDAAFAVEIYCQ
jgi:hypothetical protein